MHDVIIEYIFHRLSVKGCMEVRFDDRKVYHEVVIDIIKRTFNVDEFEAEGYLCYCVLELDSEFSYLHWTLLKEPVFEPLWLNGQVAGNGYYAGIDPAMGDDAVVINFLVRERMGVRIIQQDMAPIVNLPIA